MPEYWIRDSSDLLADLLRADFIDLTFVEAKNEMKQGIYVRLRPLGYRVAYAVREHIAEGRSLHGFSLVEIEPLPEAGDA